jgi:hypothetical protein
VQRNKGFRVSLGPVRSDRPCNRQLFCARWKSAKNPFDQQPFEGQIFFFNKAGEVGNLPRNFINGAPFLNWDAGLSKNIRLTETTRLQLRFEGFNVLNKQVPFFGANLNIDSNTFGRITGSYNAPRVVQFAARIDF